MDKSMTFSHHMTRLFSSARKHDPILISSINYKSRSRTRQEDDDTSRGWLFARKIVHHKCFKTTSLILILMSSAQLGLATDFDAEGWERIFSVLDNVYTIAFLLESVLKLMAYRTSFFKNPWNLLDFSVAMASVLDVWIFPRVYSSREDTPYLFQWCRSLRLLRVVKLLQVVPELMLVTEGLMSSLRSMFWIFTLVTLILYAVSVYCTDIVGGKTEEYGGHNIDDDFVAEEASKYFNNYQYFGTIGRSMVSLVGLIFLSEWSLIVRPIFEKQPVVIFVLIGLVVLTTFGVMNIIIGVVVERTTHVMSRLEAEGEEKKNFEKMKMFHKIKDLMFAFDVDGDRLLSVDEMEQGAEKNNDIREFLRQLDFPENFTFEELHRMLDVDGSGMVTREEFINGMFRLVHNTDFHRDCVFQGVMSLILQNQRQLHQEVMHNLREMSRSFNREIHDLRQCLSAGTNERSLSHFRPVSFEPVMKRAERQISPQSANSLPLSEDFPLLKTRTTEYSSRSVTVVTDDIGPKISSFSHVIPKPSMISHERVDCVDWPYEVSPRSSGWTCTLPTLTNHRRPVPTSTPRNICVLEISTPTGTPRIASPTRTSPRPRPETPRNSVRTSIAHGFKS